MARHCAPVGERDVLDVGGRPGDTGVVDQDVDATEVVDGARRTTSRDRGGRRRGRPGHPTTEGLRTTSASNAWRERSQVCTRAPFLANVSAMTAPMPPAPAVTMTRKRISHCTIVRGAACKRRGRTHRCSAVDCESGEWPLRRSPFGGRRPRVRRCGCRRTRTRSCSRGRPSSPDDRGGRPRPHAGGSVTGRVRVVAPMHGGQRRPDDRVWAVRCHAVPIGTGPRKP